MLKTIRLAPTFSLRAVRCPRKPRNEPQQTHPFKFNMQPTKNQSFQQFPLKQFNHKGAEYCSVYEYANATENTQ